MFRKTVGAVAGLCGSAIDVLDAAIFAGFAQDKLLSSLFKPLGCLMAAATLPGPCLEEKTDKQVFRLLGYIPAATANIAIWALEGPAVAYVFTAAIGTSGAIMLAEAAYKTYHGEEVNKLDLLIRSGKTASILLTINLGGTGKILELLKTGGVTVAHKAVSYAAAGFAAIGALKSLGTFAKSLCGPSESKDVLDDHEYVELENPNTSKL